MTERVARACASRPWRVLGGWVGSSLLGRDIASLESVQHPRFEFGNAGQPWQPTPRHAASIDEDTCRPPPIDNHADRDRRTKAAED